MTASRFSRTARAPSRSALPLALIAAASVVVGTPLTSANAQPSPPAQTETTFAIPAGPLDAALRRFGEQSGLTVTINAALTRGLTSPGASGTLDTEAALAKILTDSGLSYRFIDAQTVTLEPVAANQVGEVVLDPIGVVGTRLTDPVIGDETALGVLGQRDIIDTPYSVSAFTEDLVENTNARSVKDVITRDPSVSSEVNSAGFRDAFSIRGFAVNRGTILYDGLPGLNPTDGYLGLTNLERVEVFRGVNAFNSGAGVFGGVGGTINLVPKRPVDEPINQVTLGYEEDNSPFGSVDFSRRFGANNQFGLRLNGFYQGEAGTVDEFERRTETYALYLDWQATERLTLSGEISRFRSRSDGYRDDVFLEAGVPIPGVPNDLTLNYAQPWSFIEQSGLRYYGNVRWEFIDNWTLSAGYGEIKGDSDNGYYSVFGRVQDEAGTLNQIPFRSFQPRRDTAGGQIKVEGNFELGPVSNRVIAGVTYAEEDQVFPGAPGAISPVVSNLFDPVYVPEVPIGEIDDSGFLKAEVRTFIGLYEASLFDDRVSALAGLREVQIDLDSDFATYDDRETGLFGALSFKPIENSLVYISYSEGLERGDTAPDSAVNANEELAPSVAEQIELGAKYEFRNAIASIALFQIERPLAELNAANVFGEAGNQRHRGIELRLEGEPVNGFRVIGGVTYLDAKIDSLDAAIDGNHPAGVPAWSTALYGEYDLPFVQGLTFSGGLRYESEQFIDNENFANREADSWIEVDLGARYAFEVAEVPLTARLFVDNVFDEGYWGVNEFSGLQLSTPRTVGLSLTAGF